MLVLTRKPDQSIMVGSDIEITVLEVRGEQVRLGIRAPRNVTVHRKEVFEQIRRVFGCKLFDTVITKSVRLEESPAYKESIFTFAPQSISRTGRNFARWPGPACERMTT